MTTSKMIKSLIFILISGLLYAQNNSISGFITDQENGEALIGANVFIQETGNGMSTDRNGYYVLQNILPGNYKLIVSYIGYTTLKQEINIVENESIKLDLSLIIEISLKLRLFLMPIPIDFAKASLAANLFEK